MTPAPSVFSPPLLPPPARRLTYLRALAARDWGVPSGFGGRTCFQAIPALELERLGEAGGVFRPEWITYSLALVERRQDCQDFAMAGLLHLLYRYPDSALFQGSLQETVGAALRVAKYAHDDPNTDSCCWHTENHQVLYASAELLAGQRWPDAVFANDGELGCWHYERARENLHRWLDWRLRFGFSEWNSSCYYDEDAAALLNLVAFAADAALRQQARVVLEVLLLHVALHTWHGLSVGSQGRTYLAEQAAPGTTPMATLSQLCWGPVTAPPPTHLGLAAILLAASDFPVPPALVALAQDEPAERETRERHSLDAEEGAAFGVFPDRLRDYPFFAGAGQEQHALVVDSRFVHFHGQAKWPGYFAAREYYARCRARGEPIVAAAHLPHALGHADVYAFHTPDYALGCAQSFRPGTPGYQQFIWCATLGPQAVVYTTNPAPPDVPYGRPGPWVGHGVLPQAQQHRNVLICLHRVLPCPIYDQPPWFREDRSHAYFPRAAFDEVVEAGGWCCGRHGTGYVGLRPLRPARWLPPAAGASPLLPAAQPYEWEVPEPSCAWICELGSARTHGRFADFVAALAAARVEGDVSALRYDSPSLGTVEAGWGRELVVAGRQIVTRDYPRFATPYGSGSFGSREYGITFAGLAWHCRGLRPDEPPAAGDCPA